MKKVFFTGFLFLSATLMLCSQNRTQDYVEQLKSSFQSARHSDQTTTLFSIKEEGFDRYGLAPLEKEGLLLKIEKETQAKLFREAPEVIALSIPQKERAALQLQLVKVDVVSDDFKLYDSAKPNVPIDYQSSVHYRGVIEGDTEGIAAFSFFEEEVMGFIIKDGKNQSLSRLQGQERGTYALFHDADFPDALDLTCATPDDDHRAYTEEELFSGQGRASNDPPPCLKIYVEINHDIVADKLGAVNATDYVTGLFNQSFLLFAIEDIKMEISQILAWSNTSPYTSLPSNIPNAIAMLNEFQNNTGAFNGDLGHLVAYGNAGVAAGTNGLCASNTDNSLCISGIRKTYLDVLPYSFPVSIVSHEMGHLLGSRHTHACVWNGNGTAIDGCTDVEGTCPLPPLPPFGGTIMSYCHGVPSVGINFTFAFGNQPGNLIRNNIAAASCLSACTAPDPYCSASGVTNGSEFINQVQLHSVDNKSGDDGGYGDFTNLENKLDYGFTYTFKGYPENTSFPVERYWTLFIDWNLDGDFDDADEFIGAAVGGGVVNIPVTVSDNAINGVPTRMRVVMSVGQPAGSCAVGFTGEVEDYVIKSIGVCVPPTDFEVNNLSQFNASIEWGEVGTAYDYIFQYRVQGGTSWTTIANPGNPLFLSNLTPGTTYEYRVASLCVFGSTSTYSPINTFTTVTGYCQAGGLTTQYEYIDDFKFGSIDNKSGEDGGYGDYTNLSTTLVRGQTYTLLMSIALPSNLNDIRNGRIWIDINGNNNLEFNEEVGVFFISFPMTAAVDVAVDITIPTNITANPTLLRVSLRGEGVVPLPCEVFDRGETEDYTIIVPGGSDDDGGGNIITNNSLTVIDFSLRPNPAKEQVQVLLDEISYEDNYYLSLTNLLGQQVYTRQLTEISTEIPVTDLAKGVYMVKIETKDKLIGVQKLVVH